MKTTISILEIFGKTITSYDGWNGDHKSIKITSVSFNEESDEFKFSGPGYWGNELSIWVPKSKVEELFETGKASTENTIDHCSIVKEWTIK